MFATRLCTPQEDKNRDENLNDESLVKGTKNGTISRFNTTICDIETLRGEDDNNNTEIEDDLDLGMLLMLLSYV